MNPRPVETTFQYCPDCGIPATIVGAIPFRCEKCGYAHFFGPVAAVGGLVMNSENELLMVRRAQNPQRGKWGLPGGFVDRGETIAEALSREVREETCLTVSSSQFLISFPNLYDYQGVVAPVIDLFFTCQVRAGDSVKLDLNELDDFEWVYPSHERLQEMAFDSNRKAIEFWMRK